jgi:hypothetical protein
MMKTFFYFSHPLLHHTSIPAPSMKQQKKGNDFLAKTERYYEKRKRIFGSLAEGSGSHSRIIIPPRDDFLSRPLAHNPHITSVD